MTKSLATKYLLQELAGGMSARYGIIRDLIPRMGQAFPLGAHSFYPHFSNGEELGVKYNSASGTNIEFLDTQISTVGEAYERYACGFKIPCLYSETPQTYKQLEGLDRVSPEELRYFSSTQYNNRSFAFKKYTKDLPLYWGRGRDLLNNRDVLAPDSAISCFTPLAPRLFPNSTNGVGFGASFNYALRSGFLELIERDSVLGFWWSKISGPRIQLSTIQDPTSLKLISILQGAGFKVHIVDATSDLGIPVVIPMLRSTDPLQFAFLMSAACRETYEEAIQKALVELLQFLAYQRTLLTKKFSGQWDQEVLSFGDHFNLHSKHESRSFNEFLTAGPEIPCPTSRFRPSENVQELIQQIGVCGYRTIAFDLTPRDLRQLGFFVVRAFVPGLIPINSSHVYRPWGIPRVYEYRQRMKISNALLGEAELNQIPHPFP